MRRLAFALPFALLSCSQPDPLVVQDAWARDTVGRKANAAVFMTIKSGTSDRLMGASAPVANKTDLMSFERESDAMAMRYVKGIDVPADKPVSLNPGGLHIWLADLNEPLKAGQTFPLTLKFAKSGEHRVLVSIIGPAAEPPNTEE
jgi:copper(I)-binding protein